MLRRTILLAGLVVLLAAVSSCIFDAKEQEPDEEKPQGFKPLTTREAVLNNIEVAYEKRRLDKYDELLDVNFTFFLSTGDVGGGLPESWGRADEITANSNLFNQTPPPPFPRCKRIQMDVKWEDGVSWSSSFPGGGTDEWHTTTVNYEFKIDVDPDMTYLNNPTAQAQFTVHNIGTEDAPDWRLVEFRDLGD